MSNDVLVVRDRLRSVVIIRTSEGSGSGFYASNAGIIVTNKHVIGPFLSVTVQRFDRSQIEAKVVRVARGYDLALLWDQSSGTPPPIPLGDSAEVAPGEAVHAIGHPHGLDFTVTRGIVSAPARYVNGAYFVQTDAVAHPGSSGGPLLDATGRVVGVSTFGMREDGLNFALSVRYVHELLGEMMVKPVAPGFRRCVLCGTKNSAARRSCRKCGATFEGQPLEDIRQADEQPPAPPPIAPSTPPVIEIAHAPEVAGPESQRPPESTAPDPLLDDLVQAVEALEPSPRDVSARGRAVHFTWIDVPLSITVFRKTSDPHVSVTAFALDVPPDDAARVLRRALEANLASTVEAKIGLRGSQIYVAADRRLDAADRGEVSALVRRVTDVRARFLADVGV